MNDRAVALLEQYDIQINRTYKGRECMILETSQGMKLMAEYKGRVDKLPLIQRIQQDVEEIVRTDAMLTNREGTLYVKDRDGVIYVVKEYVEGHECSYKVEEEVLLAFVGMARLHTVLEQVTEEEFLALPRHDYRKTMQKHTMEMQHIRNYIQRKNHKTEFERALLQGYPYYLEQARLMTRRAQAMEPQEEGALCLCHGDYQYHNLIYGKEGMGLLHFEKLCRESVVRDIYYMFRKISEKNDWSIPLATKMLAAYESQRKLSVEEKEELYIRLAYPEKFWKIANFYYNSRKSWIPDKNMEKLHKLMRQEPLKQRLLGQIFN